MNMKTGTTDYYRNDDDGPLKSGIEGKEFVIRIGLGRLKRCLQNDYGSMYECKLRNKVGMAEDIAEAFKGGDETGNTPLMESLTEFLETMAEAVSNDGSEHISPPCRHPRHAGSMNPDIKS